MTCKQEWWCLIIVVIKPNQSEYNGSTKHHIYRDNTTLEFIAACVVELLTSKPTFLRNWRGLATYLEQQISQHSGPLSRGFQAICVSALCKHQAFSHFHNAI